MTFDVTILGSNSALPAHGRHPTSQVVNHNDKLFLIDCGEGTQMRLSELKIKRSKIDQIFLSHFHGDHYYGLMGLITSYHLSQRQAPLHIFAPPGLREIIDANFKYSQTHLVFDLQIHEIDCSASKLIFENEDLTVETIPMNHRIPCCGFLFREKKHARKINPAKLQEYSIPIDAIADLKAGKDFNFDGKIISNAELTFDPIAPRGYAFCSDTLYNENLIPILTEVDLLYHESTFMNESADRAAQTFHSTTLQAATIAKKAGVKKLLIGHFSAKYIDLELMVEEARTIFQNTFLAIEGERFNVTSEVLQRTD
jgi:ribonuclease Z